MTSTVVPDAPRITSPGLSARPPGMFSVVGTTPITRIGALEQRRRAQGANHGCAAGHVHLHPLHAVGGLDRDAAGVKRDALAHQPEHRPGGAPGGLCSSTITRGGSALPCATPSSRPMPRARISRFVEHGHRQRRAFSGGLGAPRQFARRQHVGRLVAQRTRQVRALGQHSSPGDRGARAPARCASLVSLSAIRHTRRARGQIGRRALEMPRVVLRQDDAFGRRLHDTAGRSSSRRPARRSRYR